MSKTGSYAAALSSLLICSQAVLAQVGLDELIARIGQENIPTGANVIVSQVEAPSGSSYGPDQSNPQFDGKDFFAMSGSPGNSGHATSVASNMYGNTSSIAPGITDIYLYEVNNWAQSGFLRVAQGSGNPPLIPPADIKVFNHSWIGSFGNDSFDNDALRRSDFVMQRDNLLMVVGVNNGGASSPLMSHIYNGLAVGLTNGGHTSDATMAGIDGPGRMKPEIVAPSSQTSFSTPIVSAAVALMNEIAVTDPSVSSNPNAQRSDVVKAILLGGGNHREAWTNNPDTTGPARGFTDQPLDDVFGVDEVNINTSHLIMTGAEQDGVDTPPRSGNITAAGWDLATVPLDASKFWRFGISGLADEVSILATWHREVSQFFTVFWVADFELILWGVDQNGELFSLLGDGGVDDFGSGNVVCDSPVDNIEHLYIRDLAPGNYVLELSRLDSLTAFPDWDVAVTWVLPADLMLPSIACPADVTIECSADVPAVDTGSVTASDGCGGTTITHEGDTSDGMSCPETVLRTYRATDLCGNFVECTQTITVDDVTAPVLDPCPANIMVNADAGGCDAVVTYSSPGATDNCDSAPMVVCSPPSGSIFLAGTTAVTCTATDACGNSSPCSFDVTVDPVNIVNVEVELIGVLVEGPRCIHFVTDDCGNTTDQPLSFVDHDVNGATAVRTVAASIEVACGASTTLCAKDEQHSLFATTSLSIVGSEYVTGTLLSLAGGDDDNDSDVDINDVTYLIATFGDLAADGGCPWDATRDADFSHNGAVGSEDYTFQATNWLMFSSCPCTVSGMGGGNLVGGSWISVGDLPPQLGARADLNRDGVVDFRDVQKLELRHGLSGALSSKMKASTKLDPTTKVESPE